MSEPRYLLVLQNLMTPDDVKMTDMGEKEKNYTFAGKLKKIVSKFLYFYEKGFVNHQEVQE